MKQPAYRVYNHDMNNQVINQSTQNQTVNQAVATLAGGCFWCVEAVFENVRGVSKVESGFAGGVMLNLTYRQVCSGESGHAEVIQVTFDPSTVSYEELLLVFFTVHDPTTRNRQGADVGTQYRSAVFYHDAAQKAVAEQVIARLTAECLWPNPIVTEVAPFDAFYIAEAYHQQYYRKNANQPYCQIVIAPKVTKFRKAYAYLLK
jgi:peptide-methionine (S)-S-oxide reductase